MPIAIGIDRSRIAEFCQANHIRKLALFGSVLRSDFTTDSDVDVLVEFEPGHIPGLAFFGMEDDLNPSTQGLRCPGRGRFRRNHTVEGFKRDSWQKG